MGWIKKNYDWDWAGADAAFKRALELEPGSADAIRGAAYLAFGLGRFDEAILLGRQAIELDPLRIHGYANLCHHAYYAGRLAESEAACRKALELNSQFPGAHSLLGRIYLARTKPQEALAEMQNELDPRSREQGLVLAYHAAGKKKEADIALTEYIEKYQKGDPFGIAEIYAFRGDTDKGFEWLEHAYERRDPGLTILKGNPLLRSLEHDPRWPAFLKKMKLPLD